MKSDAFTGAIKAEDPEALTNALAEDVVFRSPVVFRAYEGKPVVSTILTQGAMKVFEDFRYVERFEDGDAAALIFKARVGDREVDGLDLLRFDGDGKVAELIVMVRPMSGLNALAEAMGREFERLGHHPARWRLSRSPEIARTRAIDVRNPAGGRLHAAANPRSLSAREFRSSRS